MADPRSTAPRSAIGGGGLMNIFALGTTAFGTKDTHLYEQQTGLKLTGIPAANKVVIDIENQIADGTFLTHLALYVSNQAPSIVTMETEDSRIFTSCSIKSGSSFGVIYYFASIGSNRKVYYGECVYTGDMNLTVAGKAFEKWPVQMTAIPARYTYSIPAASFDSFFVSGAVTGSLPLGAYGVLTDMTSA